MEARRVEEGHRVGEMESGCLFRAGHHAALECRTGKLRQTELRGQSQQSRSLVFEASPHSHFPCYSSPNLQGAPRTQGPGKGSGDRQGLWFSHGGLGQGVRPL